MKKIASISLFCVLLIITAFLIFGNIETWIEINLSSEKSLAIYAIVSFGILTSDIILPIPSSLVMILNGKVLEIFFGTILSATSSLLSSIIGFYLGRKSSTFLDKFFSKNDVATSNKLFQKFGNSTIIISKALPIISETVSFVAGTTLISFKRFFFYSLVGHLVISIIYACAGNFAGSANSNLIAAITIIGVLLISWVIQFLIRRKTAHTKGIAASGAGRHKIPT